MADESSRAGRTYLEPAIVAWLNEVHAPHDGGLAQAFAAPGREGMPAIQVGAAEGRLLELLIRLAGARRVVEIGTLAGYSALWMARGLPPDGWVSTIESDEKHAAVARANIEAAGESHRIRVVIGRALEVLPTLEAEGPFDAVFIDADKGSYDAYGRWAAKNVRPGGLLLGDNAFFFGKLLAENDPSAEAMRRFHEEARDAFDTVCIPTPDGLLLGVRR